MERGDFVVNSQQDVPEVLNYILDNFCGISILAQDQIGSYKEKKYMHELHNREDIHMIMNC